MTAHACEIVKGQVWQENVNRLHVFIGGVCVARMIPLTDRYFLRSLNIFQAFDIQSMAPAQTHVRSLHPHRAEMKVWSLCSNY